MFDSYEHHQQASSVSSSCEMESMDEIPPPSASSILSLNDDLTISTRLSTTAPQSSVTLRFKVSNMLMSIFVSSFLLTNQFRKNVNVNSNPIQFLFVHSKILLAIIFNVRNAYHYHVYHQSPNYSVQCVIELSICFKQRNNHHQQIF